MINIEIHKHLSYHTLLITYNWYRPYRALNLSIMSTSKKYNVAVIGYGMSAKIFQIPFINAVPEHFKFYAVVQRKPTAENNAEKDWPGIKSYRSAEELVKDENVDLVVVGTSPGSHFELTKLCLENGKHGMSQNLECFPS